ncbi:hypothetical protein HDF24_14830 [Mucilaginibacter sp. X4EP1]|uniref:hypothetical protein n=1 Tax=Mucilaginibacter sp. X4EP1 TaxID=2723092 RepID=UPI002168AF30|nr:hypothetical protein [Mucilaginibacter sp. X4EP1]MCS3815431.1 hypothetical protein [Mucilaginibacter sp. X4EP1]
MKIAAHVLAYNVNRFLSEVLKNIEPHVDKIYVAHAERPFGYIEASRQTKTNPTKVSDIIAASSSDKIEIVKGDWLTEEDMRNACLTRAKEAGFDWFIIQDADEFYTNSSWDQIKEILKNNKTDDLLKTNWYNFWKSSHYIIVNENGSIKETNAGFAIRCTPDIKFMHKRVCNAKNVRTIDLPCYHYGYVMSDQEMSEKLSTWSHAQETNADKWFKFKWENWTEETRYLHPTNPPAWLKAIKFPMHQPDFAEQFALPLAEVSNKPIGDLFGEKFFNLKARKNTAIRSFKKMIKSLY